MGKIKITIEGYKCERCRHEWIPRNQEEHPRVCPACKSPYWDKPRKKSNKA
jgi:DNA-directed RNA polymerase subunit RPC12/RpoP